MSSIATTPAASAAQIRRPGVALHNFLLHVLVIAGAALTLGLVIYGANYYTLDQAHRALSPKHPYLRPSGVIGIRLGLLGVGLFFCLFLYAIRKSWKLLSKVGNSRHWLNFHVILGVLAPVVTTFHSSFKFRGLAGIAYWIMIAVAISGFIGRYIYAQIPRSLGAAEVSMKELRAESARLAERLKVQEVLAPEDFATLLRLPSPAEVQSMSSQEVLWLMLRFDLARRWGIAELRRKALRSFGGNAVMWGMVRSHHPQVESVIDCLNEEAYLNKKALFLSKAQELFQLWHVVHRPFSYSFVVLASIHIAVVLLLGYF